MTKTTEYKIHKENSEMAASFVAGGFLAAGIGIIADVKPVAKAALIGGGILLSGIGICAMDRAEDECARLYSEMDVDEKVQTRVDSFVENYKKTHK